MTQREYDIVVCQHVMAMSQRRMEDHKWWRAYSAIWCGVFIVTGLAGGIGDPISDAICLAVVAISFFARHWFIHRERATYSHLAAHRATLGELKVEEVSGDQAEVAESSAG